MPKTSFADNTLLRARPARAIVRAIADAAERWSNADFPPRVRATAAIRTRLGFSIPVVDYALDRLFEGITADALTATVASELGSLDALDQFTPVNGRPASWARGVDAVTIISSDSTIGVAIAPLVFALLAKCAVTVKDRNDALVASFVETLGEELPELAAATHVREWDGATDLDETRRLRLADVVVAFGRDETLGEIRAHCGVNATFVPFGHRISAAYLSAADLDADLDALAMRIARDALLYDGTGCLSLHWLFVQRTDAAARERLLHALKRAFELTVIEFPPALRDERGTASFSAVTHAAEFRASLGAGALLRAHDNTWALTIDPPADEIPPFGDGIIPVLFVDDIADAGARLARFKVPLETIGIGDAPITGAAEAEIALCTGAVRIARIGSMQDPPLAGHHGGRARIADFIRWIDRA